jgi:hypothetical protein
MSAEGMQEWWSAAELAAAKLPGLPSTQNGINRLAARQDWARAEDLQGRVLARYRRGKGGGWVYHVDLLPQPARAAIEARAARAAVRAYQARHLPPPRSQEEIDAERAQLWAGLDRAASRVRQEAETRLVALDAFEDLHWGGLPVMEAAEAVAGRLKVHRNTVLGWRDRVKGRPRDLWLPLLAPGWRGRRRAADYHPDIWDLFKADYLRLEKPSAQAVHRRVAAIAAERGWQMPEVRVLTARLHAEVPAIVQIFLREGQAGIRRVEPKQKRDRSMFRAMQGINIDGHVLDVWVRWEDGEVLRPVATMVQDLYSGKLVGWRIDKSETAAAVRLAVLDVFRDWGIPEFAVLDNGRAFASKQITGGQKTRFRFKVQEDEIDGLLTQAGVRVHWTLPYSGQSKPIERAFRDIAEDVSRHPALAGSYAGNSPANKPDYAGGPKPAAFETFMRVFEEGIRLHNAREGRRSEVAQGRSLDAVFEESYRSQPVTRASAQQMRLMMLTGERTKIRRDGGVELYGNRYWAAWMLDHIGTSVTARFDPDALHDGIAVEADGRFLGDAECTVAEGFLSLEDARAHARERGRLRRHVRDAAAAELRIDAIEMAGMIPGAPPPQKPEPKVVRLAGRRRAAGGAAAEAWEPQFDSAEVNAALDAGLDRLIALRRGPLD